MQLTQAVNRCIDLGTDNVTTHDEPSYYDKKVVVSSTGTVITERFRENDYIVVRVQQELHEAGDHGSEYVSSFYERRIPAKIDFNWLLRHTVTEPDDDVGMPWDDQDGWEHKLIDFDSFRGSLDDLRKTRGYLNPHKHGYTCVRVTDESFCGDSRQARIDRLRNKGASKQVAREAVAAQDRRYIDQIVEWYTDGYQCVCVSLDVIAAGQCYYACCGGFELEARDDAKEEIAGEVASQLESDGFIVVGSPFQKAATTYAEIQRKYAVERCRRNINMFNCEGE